MEVLKYHSVFSGKNHRMFLLRNRIFVLLYVLLLYACCAKI